MNVTPIPSSWIDDHGDAILQDRDGHTVRVPADELHALHDEARASDSETARWSGHLWHRDHLAGAMDLAIKSGLIDTCRARYGRRVCESPVRPGETACPNHEIGATA